MWRSAVRCSSSVGGVGEVASSRKTLMRKGYQLGDVLAWLLGAKLARGLYSDVKRAATEASRGAKML